METLCKFTKKKEDDEYIEVAAITGSFSVLYSCFDIENRMSIPYAFLISFNGEDYIGRSLDDLKAFLSHLTASYSLNIKRRIYLYDCELAHDFLGLIQHLNVAQCFAPEEYDPYRVLLDCGVEFRDFDVLVGKSTVTTPFFTNDIVTKDTPLTWNDINTLKDAAAQINRYMSDQLTYYKNAARLPLTNSGRARKELKKLFRDPYYYKLMQDFVMDIGEYEVLNRAYHGGLCMCKDDIINETLTGIGSFDLISSYLATIVSEMFPMSSGISVGNKTLEEIEELSKEYLWVADVRLMEVTSKGEYAFIDPLNCTKVESPTYRCGNIKNARKIIASMTNVDFYTIKRYYNIEHADFANVYIYHRDYLPKAYIEKCLEAYETKSKLKDDPGRKVEYGIKKAVLNAMCYGLMVQSPVKQNVIYKDHEWTREDEPLADKIDKYNARKGRFVHYPWGVWVSSFARRNLIDTIMGTWEGKKIYDYFCYSDTDSIKLRDYKQFIGYFNKYDEWITKRIEKACERLGINVELTRPVNENNGVIYYLGTWEFEGESSYWKTLGEKRYMMYNDIEGLQVKASGVNCKGATEYMSHFKDPFAEFDNNLEIPEEYSGRTISYIIKDKRAAHVTDRDGVERDCECDGGIYMKRNSFHFILSDIIAMERSIVKRK